MSNAVPAEKLSEAVEAFEACKSVAAHENALARDALNEVVKEFGLNKAALTFALKLRGMDDVNRRYALRALFEYVVKLGITDGASLVDDAASAGEHAAGDPVINKIVGGE